MVLVVGSLGHSALGQDAAPDSARRAASGESSGAATARAPRLAVDSSRVDVRQLPDSVVARLQRDPAYDYRAADTWTWWADLKAWVGERFVEWFGDAAGSGWVLRALLYVLLAAIIGYATYMLVQLRTRARPPGRSRASSVSTPQTREAMQTIDFEAQVEAAVAERRYRDAVRLLYLQTLQALDEAGAIAWEPSKTNRTYVRELEGTRQAEFEALTRLFERVWYGGAALQRAGFEDVRERFAAFQEEAARSTTDRSKSDSSAPGEPEPSAAPA